MKELVQIINIEMNGGDWYIDIETQRLFPIGKYGVPLQSIKHIYTDICPCEGRNPFCSGKMKIEMELMLN